jgi:hypothetical protein
VTRGNFFKTHKYEPLKVLSSDNVSKVSTHSTLSVRVGMNN